MDWHCKTTIRVPTKNGFTLIELLIAVVIVGILAAMAYPAYTNYVIESRRSDAHIALSQLSNDLEKFYSECSAYTASIVSATGRSCSTPAGGSLGRSVGGNASPNGHYQLSIQVDVARQTYTITATAQGIQQRDTNCATLSLNNTGARSATGTNTARCWRR
jgi:type IV pilus assembly protein PilE